jgi:hypothetical protein
MPSFTSEGIRNLIFLIMRMGNSTRGRRALACWIGLQCQLIQGHVMAVHATMWQKDSMSWTWPTKLVGAMRQEGVFVLIETSEATTHNTEGLRNSTGGSWQGRGKTKVLEEQIPFSFLVFEFFKTSKGNIERKRLDGSLSWPCNSKKSGFAVDTILDFLLVLQQRR